MIAADVIGVALPFANFSVVASYVTHLSLAHIPAAIYGKNALGHQILS